MNVAVSNIKAPGQGITPNRHQHRYNATRQRLIESARVIFAEKGLDRTTVDDVTQRADVGRGTFYYHFDGMSELIGEMIQNLLDGLIADMEADCEGKVELDELLDAMIRSHVEFFSKRWEDFVLFYQGRADLTLVDGYEGIETPFMEYLNCIEKLVDAAVFQTIPRPVLRRLACAIAGFISGYYSFAVISSGDEDVDKNFMLLRSAFVASLVRFIKEALPDTRNGRH